ncbi:MAG: SprT-like domain-containing protein [Enterobacterales bacterium]|nr:SprT-like domain-containing protein [Enterobacterales bacterium]
MLEAVKQLTKEIQGQLTEQYPFLSQWDIGFDNAKKRAGICRINEKKIAISRNHINNNSIETIEDTIRHEFAHAIAYHLYGETGHGKSWKKVAIQLGAKARARASFNLPKAPWVLVHRCPETQSIKLLSERFRRNKKIKNYFLSGQPDTKGELYFIKHTDYLEFAQGKRKQKALNFLQ